MVVADALIVLLVVFGVGFVSGHLSGRGRAELRGHEAGLKEGRALGYDEAWRKFGAPLLDDSTDR